MRVVRRLAGGTHAATHLLESSDAGKQIVLRRFPHGDTAAANEARVPNLLDGLDGWAPRLLAADPDGRRFGEPAVLITRLPGHADITSVAPETAAIRLGHVLARLHGTTPAPFTGLRDGMAAALASPTRQDGTAPARERSRHTAVVSPRPNVPSPTTARLRHRLVPPRPGAALRPGHGRGVHRPLPGRGRPARRRPPALGLVRSHQLPPLLDPPTPPPLP
ncbi:phosphotransferase [Spirillospora sp. NBC_00431]